MFFLIPVINVIPDENLETTKKSINLDAKTQMLKGIVKDLISSNKDKIDFEEIGYNRLAYG